MVKKSKVKVSIFMLTYNQEAYISQAIEGVLMQKTNFNYQLVIGEDCSTDNTRQICEQYAKNYPQKIKLLPNLNKNIGLIKNYIRTIKECHGKYIAICDGDDYWIDKYKLQKQVDFLETNPKYYIVGTNLKRLYNDGTLESSNENKLKPNFGFNDLIFDNVIASVTVLFKNIQKNATIPQWIEKFPYGDWQTYLWTVKEKGKVFIMNDITAVYRTDIGVSASIRKKHSETAKINLKIVECIASDSNFSHKRDIVKKSIFQHKKNLMNCYNREKQYIKALKVFFGLLLSGKEIGKLTKFYMYSLKKSFSLNVW